MVQCEMCGAETSSPKTVKVEGAELDVCENCTDFGTEVRSQETESTSTKYSTGSSSTGSSSTDSSTSSTGGSSYSSSSSSPNSSRSDMFDDVEELAQDYDDRIRNARESRGLSQADLADELNEKASLIRKLERGETLPSDEVQRKLEGHLDISLSAEGSTGDNEWESDSTTTTTLGDVVQRKDR